MLLILATESIARTFFEFFFFPGVDVDTEDDISPDSEESDSDMEVTCSSTTRTQLPKFDQACGPTITLPASVTACDFFELIFSDNIIDQIVAQANIHALSNSLSSGYRKWQNATPKMVRSFLGGGYSYRSQKICSNG